MKSADLVEEKCQACDGAGHQAVKQPPNQTAGYIRRLARNAAGKGGSRRAKFYVAVESGGGPRRRSDRIDLRHFCS